MDSYALIAFRPGSGQVGANRADSCNLYTNNSLSEGRGKAAARPHASETIGLKTSWNAYDPCPMEAIGVGSPPVLRILYCRVASFFSSRLLGLEAGVR